VPEVEQLLPRFRAAHTQVLGISVDSIYCHANWARDLGGISFPLLADFEPKGEVGRKYGLYLDGPGIDDRATVIVDSSGIVRHASTVGPGGRRDIAELAALCEALDAEHGGGLEAFPAPPGLPEGSILYVKSHCGFSRAALIACDNLHLQERLELRNVSEDEEARSALVALCGTDQAPCLVVEGRPLHESSDIIRHLVNATSDLTA
jgi:glutaredoxin-related protein